jgi:hypothetical protein
VALGMTLTLALGSVSSALAKAPVHAGATTAYVSHTTLVPVRTLAKNLPVAHAAGHKIA